MSKELIERLREDGKFLGGNFGKLMHEAADALEAKAAPVGEREAFEAAWSAGEFEPAFMEDFELCLQCFQAGAAYQRAQQPQSAEAVVPQWRYDALVQHAKHQDKVIAKLSDEKNTAWLYEQKEVWFWQGDGEDYPESLCCPVVIKADDLRMLIAAATPQPSAGVVMPERKSKPYGKLYMPDKYEGWNACLDEFARLNAKEVGRG